MSARWRRARSMLRWPRDRRVRSSCGALDSSSGRCWYCAAASLLSARRLSRSLREGGTMIELRKIVTVVEEIFHEFGPPPPRPLKMGAVAAVLKNPYAGRYVPDIMPFMDAL